METLPSPLKSGPEEIGKMVLDVGHTGVPEANDGRPTPFGLPLMLGAQVDRNAPPSPLLAYRVPTSTITNMDGWNDEKFIDDKR